MPGYSPESPSYEVSSPVDGDDRVAIIESEEVEMGKSGLSEEEMAKRITTPYMTKYERARVLGTSALQIR